MYYVINMLKLDLSQIKSVSELPRNYNALIRESEEKGALIFFRRNKPITVLLSFDNWQQLEEIKRKKGEEIALKTINESENEFKSGKAKLLNSLKNLK